MNSDLQQFFSLEKVKDSQKNFLACLIIILLTLVCFSNSLLGEFIYDDVIVVVENTNIKNLSNIFDLFLQPYWGKNNAQGLYRPLANVTYALNFAICGKDPYGYHLVSIAVHIINSLLIYWLGQLYFDKKFLSLLCALFFALHPVHSEAVCGIYSRPEMLATTFILISWATYVKSNNHFILYAVSLVSYFTSLLFKESGIVLVGVLFLAQICIEKTWLAKFKPTPKLIGYFLATIPYLGLRIYVTKTLSIPKGGQFFTDETFLTRCYTMSLSYVEYFIMLVWPVNLYTDYNYDIIPKMTTLTLSVGLSLLLIGFVIFTGLWLINKSPSVAFSILFFFVTTSVVSNVLIPTGILISERTIYFPVLSICILASLIIFYIYSSGHKKTAIAISSILLMMVFARTYQRNFDFKSDFALFSSIIKIAPNHTKATFAVAAGYEKQGLLAEAENYYKKTIEMSPTFTLAYSALGNMYFAQGLYEKSLPLLNQAAKLDPYSGFAQVPLGRLYIMKGEPKKAVEAFQTAVKYSIPNAKLQHELALALFYANDLEQAEAEMKKSIELDPYFAEPYVNLARVLQKKNQIDQAQIFLDKAIKLDPNDSDAYTFYGVGLQLKGNFCDAKNYLLKALSINSQNAEAHYQLGLAYSQLNAYKEAIKELQTCLKLNSSNDEARKKLIELNKITAKQDSILCP